MTTPTQSLVLALFDSLIARPPWQAFLKQLDEYLQCQSCALMVRTPTESDSGLLSSDKLGPGSEEIFEAFQDSPFNHIPDEQVTILSQLCSEDAFKQKHPIHHNYNQRVGTIDLLATNLTDAETGMQFRFRCIRSEGFELFQKQDADKLIALLPYIKAAAALYAQLIQQQKQLYMSEETSTKLGIALIELTTEGKIISKNATAREILQTGKDLIENRNRLHCSDTRSEQQLRQFLQQLKASNNQKQTECRINIPMSDVDEGSWSVLLQEHIIPPNIRDDHHRTVSVLIRDSQNSLSLSSKELIELFGFTPAEAQLTELLLRGDSLSEAAEILGRSKSTVRVQLAAIFAKTGVHKQHQLISHILMTANRRRL